MQVDVICAHSVATNVVEGVGDGIGNPSRNVSVLLQHEPRTGAEDGEVIRKFAQVFEVAGTFGGIDGDAGVARGIGDIIDLKRVIDQFALVDQHLMKDVAQGHYHATAGKIAHTRDGDSRRRAPVCEADSAVASILYRLQPCDRSFQTTRVVRLVTGVVEDGNIPSQLRQLA